MIKIKDKAIKIEHVFYSNALCYNRTENESYIDFQQHTTDPELPVVRIFLNHALVKELKKVLNDDKF